MLRETTATLCGAGRGAGVRTTDGRLFTGRRGAGGTAGLASTAFFFAATLRAAGFFALGSLPADVRDVGRFPLPPFLDFPFAMPPSRCPSTFTWKVKSTPVRYPVLSTARRRTPVVADLIERLLRHLWPASALRRHEFASPGPQCLAGRTRAPGCRSDRWRGLLPGGARGLPARAPPYSDRRLGHRQPHPPGRREWRSRRWLPRFLRRVPFKAGARTSQPACRSVAVGLLPALRRGARDAAAIVAAMAHAGTHHPPPRRHRAV